METVAGIRGHSVQLENVMVDQRNPETPPGLMAALIPRKGGQMPAPRKYPQELRDRATRLVREARDEEPALSIEAAVHRIGRRVGIVPDTQRAWRKQADVDAVRSPGVTTSRRGDSSRPFRGRSSRLSGGFGDRRSARVVNGWTARRGSQGPTVRHLPSRSPLRVALVTGIYPPDIGGPATHASSLRAGLAEHCIDALVLTLTDGPRKVVTSRLVRYPRRWPMPLRLAAVVSWLIRNRGRYDVVYASGMQVEAAVARLVTRRPTVLKWVGDPAWERAVRLGLTDEDFETFQASGRSGGRRQVRAMRRSRSWAARNADALVAPSVYLANVVAGWMRREVPVEVIPNGVRVPPNLNAQCTKRDQQSLDLLYVGRLVSWKRVDVLLRAVAAVPSSRLTIIGSGPEEVALEQWVRQSGLADRVVFKGAVDHDEVLAAMSAAHFLVSASTYEGLPHTVIEALAVGTPILGTAAGGTTEALIDGVNGLVVEGGDHEDFVRVLEKVMADDGLRKRLAEGARRTGSEWRFERTVAKIIRCLQSVS